MRLFIALASGGGNDIPSSSSVSVLIWLGWLWVATFLAALLTAGRRALWLLFAAPFALQQPVMWVFIAHDCDLLGHCGAFFGLIARQS
jgi:hypothetical protein